MNFVDFSIIENSANPMEVSAYINRDYILLGIINSRDDYPWSRERKFYRYLRSAVVSVNYMQTTLLQTWCAHILLDTQPLISEKKTLCAARGT